MEHLLQHITDKTTVLEMLTKTFQELPNPVHVDFTEQKLRVIIWYDYAGHFTNKVYVFSSVDDMNDEISAECTRLKPTPNALSHIAHLRFSECFDVTDEKVIEDGAEGVSLCVMLSNLQRSSVGCLDRANLSHLNSED
ncbi:unnamed protein product [Gongylonema pulchrum]|uniref:Rad60-SLD domain-containing protein n=1 Tax=Gongylonema pulchrum TaxID=637853 RepID=A0A183EL35_9BILA|nr:unnamed protein product [Gongylonema pulchrum]